MQLSTSFLNGKNIIVGGNGQVSEISNTQQQAINDNFKSLMAAKIAVEEKKLGISIPISAVVLI